MLFCYYWMFKNCERKYFYRHKQLFSDTITNTNLNEYFGFVQSEVDQLLKDTELIEHFNQFQEWYDGYHFREVDVYCPWDVMNYVLDLQRKPNAKPVSYWENTSDNAIIRSFIDYAGTSITKKLEVLMAGGSINEHIDENLTYDILHSSEDNLWSMLLYLTGYLTTSKTEETFKDGTLSLMIPNKEVREIYESTVVKWFADVAKKVIERHCLTQFGQEIVKLSLKK